MAKTPEKPKSPPPAPEEPVPVPAPPPPPAAAEPPPATTEPPPPAAEAEDTTPEAWHVGDDALRDMMASNFIEYASYVIKDRAIPDIDDGLKPVQRRIMHTMFEMDDGRFHKVANVVGHSMRYHPHGDASIYSALVVLANKEYFIDRQGNFGNIFTGDDASAARYIECRLSAMAREVMFNPELTEYVDSYDGRNKEPVRLPCKVPALLMLGSDGIAVGMTTRILPHNFCELLQAQIAILRDQPFQVYPDFQTAGSMDVAEYADGAGRVRVRARIESPNEKTLVIRDIPFSTTTESLIASVEDAARRGKIKIAAINDYTAEKVEIEIGLPRGVYAAETMKQLYAYTDCEVSITSNLVVIKDNRPVIMTVSNVLRYLTERLLNDLRLELELELRKLQERFHEKTLAQIFIENRIYKRIEKCETYEAVLAEVRAGLDKFRDLLRRDITDADIEKLLQLAIRRISLFDMNKNRQEIDDILKAMEECQDNLKHLKRYTIRYLETLLKKYGAAYPRRTQITDLQNIDVRAVALRNIKVGHDRTTGFVGSEVKNSNKGEEPLVCSEFDRLVLLRNDGDYRVVPVQDKIYTGPLKLVLLADRDQIYSMLYRDRKTGAWYAKRFRIESYIMDKEYRCCPDNCIIEALYTTYGVVARLEFAPRTRLRAKFEDVTFDAIEIRSASARGFKITPNEVEHVVLLKRGSNSPQGDGEPPATEPPAGEPPPTATGPEPAATAGGSSAAPAKPATAPPPEEPPIEPETPHAAAETKRKGKAPAKARPPPAPPAKPAPPPPRAAAEPAPRPGKAKAAADKTPEPPAAKPGKKPPHAAPEKPGTPRSSKSPTPVPATPKAKTPPAPAARPEPQKQVPAAADPAAKRPIRKLIDEDAPFFLE